MKKTRIALAGLLALLLAMAGCTGPAEKADIDLTAMGSTAVDREIYQMVANPQDYQGKTVKISGSYSLIQSAETGRDYHLLLLAGETACCSQGIEFILTGEAVAPEDYPTPGQRIEFTGVYQTYEALGIANFYLATDQITVLD